MSSYCLEGRCLAEYYNRDPIHRILYWHPPKQRHPNSLGNKNKNTLSLQSASLALPHSSTWLSWTHSMDNWWLVLNQPEHILTLAQYGCPQSNLPRYTRCMDHQFLCTIQTMLGIFLVYSWYMLIFMYVWWYPSIYECYWVKQGITTWQCKFW